MVWKRGGQLGLTVVVKATFAFQPDRPATLAAPLDVVSRDRHFDKNPERSVEDAAELFPFLPGAEVLLHGHARAVSAPCRSMAVRLQLVRAEPVLDKTLDVYGDRDLARPEVVEPFMAMPLVYERALGGVAQPDNPVGCGGERAPNVVDRATPARAGGFGPLGHTWPSRRRLLQALDPRLFANQVPSLPDELDFRYFHAAPDDQRIAELVGDEWVLLSGMSAAHAEWRTQLPDARAFARAVRATHGGCTPPETIELRADRLTLDADEGRLSLLWRGHRLLAHGEQELARLGLLVGVESAGSKLSWPATGDPGPLREAFAATPVPHEGTVDLLPGAIFREGPGLGAAGSPTVARPAVAFAHAPAEPKAGDSAEPPTSAPPAPRPPVRDSDDIPVITTAPFESATLTWQIQPPQDTLVVVVKGTYDIVVQDAAGACGPARPRARSELCTGERYLDDDPDKSAVRPSDVVVFKPRSDVTMVGHACAPEGQLLRVSKVRLKVGSTRTGFDKTIHVHGDRQYKRGLAGLAPGPAEPFEKMPLVYERAFGGPDWDANPFGRGRAGTVGPPNLELHDNPVTSPGDAHPPACFAPVAQAVGVRWTQQGSYGRTWLKTRWPYFPDDFDWSCFQAAPRDQQLAHYLQGDEPFVAEGVHPAHPKLTGTLPGQRARGFVVRRPEAGGGLVEVDLRIDTCVFDFDEMSLNLVWRGRFDVRDTDAPEVLALFLLCESLDGPRATLEEAHAAYLKAITPEAPAEESPDDAPEPGDEPTSAGAPTAEEEAARARERALEQQLTEQLRAVGADPAAPPPPPDRDQIAASLRAGGATVGEIEEVLRALEPPPPPAVSEAAEPPSLRDLVMHMLDANDSFEGFDFEGADLGDLDFAGRDLSGANLHRGRFCRARFDGARLVEAQAGEADFTEATFVGADLSGADFTGSTLERARLDEAVLVDAELVRVAGRGASFVDARADAAELDDGDWTDARFTRLSAPNADFNACLLDRAHFGRADLPNVGFRGSRGEGVVFDGAALTALDGEGADFRRSSFKVVTAAGAVFDNALLDEADMRGADLRGASFLRAVCRKTNLGQTTLVEANLTRADLSGANLQRANLMNATMEAANLTIADLRDANLHGAGLWKALLLDAKLDGANLDRSSLVMKQP